MLKVCFKILNGFQILNDLEWIFWDFEWILNLDELGDEGVSSII